MRRVSLSLCAALVFTASALSQPSTSLDGTWVGRMTMAAGRAGEVEMTVRGSAGKWQVYRSTGSAGFQMKDDPCLDRAHPIVITQEAPDRYRVVVEASKTLSSCRDSRVDFTLVEPNRIEGKFAGGRELDLKRK